LTSQLDRKIPLIKQPILILVIILILSGALYFSIYFIPSVIPNRKLLAWVIIAGTVLRVLMLFSTPILEDDYFRYLWDGAVLANGVNPYAYSPEQILRYEENPDIPLKLRKLAEESGNIIHHINHPSLRSVYPPISQLVFAVAYLIKSWSMFPWRIVLLFFDFLTLALLVHVLRLLNLSPLNLAIYWWNPLLVKEIFNSGHLDLIAFPFVLGAIILSIRSRYLCSIITLALATGVKLWPIVFLPIVLRPIIPSPKRFLPVLGLFCALACALFLPVYVAGLDENSGFIAYAERWENNDSLFKLILWGSEFFLKSIDIHPGHGQRMARILVLIVTTIWVGYLAFRETRQPTELFEKCLLTAAAVFLLSPTQFPWYYTWMIPFLAVRPRPSLLFLTILLPLYYIRYYLQPRGQLEISIYIIVWIEFVPVWILLIREWYVNRKNPLQIDYPVTN